MAPPSFNALASLERSAAVTQKSIAYLRKNYRYFAADPRFFWMKSVARFEFARSFRARPHRFKVPADAATAPSAVSNVVSSACSAREMVATLEREGYVVGLQLDPQVVAGLRALCERHECYGDRRADLPFLIHERAELEARLGHRVRIATYHERQNDWPLFCALRADPLLADIARGYLGGVPFYLRSEISWTFPGARTQREKIEAAHVFHCDINGFRTLKFFFYLNDVGPQDGPHEYIKKNPKARTLLHQLMGQRVASLPEGALEHCYGANSVVSVQGPAGLGFVGDPYYFHRGNAPREGVRLLLQIEFGTHRYKTWYFDV